MTNKQALDALDGLIISLNMSHKEWCDQEAWRDDFNEKIEIIRTALTQPNQTDVDVLSVEIEASGIYSCTLTDDNSQVLRKAVNWLKEQGYLTKPNQDVNKMMLDALKGDADAAYCRYIDIIDRDCRGTEYHIEHGTFTNEMLESNKNANERLGFHRGIYHALKAISAATSAPVVEVEGLELAIKYLEGHYTVSTMSTEQAAARGKVWQAARLQLERQKGVK